MKNKDLTTIEDVKKAIKLYSSWSKEQEKRKAAFNPNTRIADAILVDEKERLFQCTTGIVKFNKPDGTIYKIDDIKEYEIQELDGKTVTKGGVGRTVAGGLAFGSAGAVVGSVTSPKETYSSCLQMYVVVTFNSLDKAYINLLESESKRTGKGSILYTVAKSKAKQIIEYFDKVTAVDEQNDNVLNMSEDVSIADELKKYTDLYKSGVLSDEEYKSIKEKLLAKL